MAKEAKATAFCLSTDATGVCIQPEPLAGRQRQACRKGHFFVVLADQDHVFFEFQPKHTSAAVCEMFRGFSGYIQADAHAIYDAIFRGEARASPDDEPPLEVGLLGALPKKGMGSGRRRQGPGGARSAPAHAQALRPRSRVGAPGARAATRATAARLATARRRLLRLGHRAVRARQGHAADWSPPRSATPSDRRPPCGASSTTGGCP